MRTLQADRGDAGMLSIGFVSIADYGILPPALKNFRTRFPNVEVELHELTTDAQIRELRAARLDLGIGLAPVDEPDLEFKSRSEEHTSELQSLMRTSYAVFCLTKKTLHIHHLITIITNDR